MAESKHDDNFRKHLKESSILQRVNESRRERFEMQIEKRKTHSTPDALFEKITAEKKLGDPTKIFFLPEKKREAVLKEFVAQAKEQFSDTQIAMSIIKYRYPAKLDGYIPVDKGQAASEIVVSTTAKVDWFKAFQGGQPIVENGVLLNGTFGIRNVRREGDAVNIGDEVADFMYLITHGIHEKTPSPQAPFVMFTGKYRGNEDFAAAKAKVLEYRSAAKAHLEGMQPDDFFNVDDEHRGATIKFRLLCTLFDMQSGKVYVVSDKAGEKTQFSTWVDRNLNNILSCNESKLSQIAADVEALNLIDKLQNPPRKAHSGYKPWKEVLEFTGGDYKEALAIWRYAIIRVQVSNVAKYEKYWNSMRDYENVMQTVRKLGCDDGRHACDMAALGSLKTKAGFDHMVDHLLNGNGKVGHIPVAFHQKCGFLTGCHNIHLGFEALPKMFGEYAEEKMALGNIQGGFDDRAHIGDVFKFLIWGNEEKGQEGKSGIINKEGRACSPLYLMKYLPNEYKEEYQNMLDTQSHANFAKDPDKRKLVEFLHAVFVSDDETLRAVIRRGHRVEALARDEKGLFYMPAAADTYRRLAEAYPDAEGNPSGRYKEVFDFGKINAFVIEEVAREYSQKYKSWMDARALYKRVAMSFYIDNFNDGRSGEIPPAQKTAAEFENFTRKDYYVNNEFTPEQARKYGLGGMGEYELNAW